MLIFISITNFIFDNPVNKAIKPLVPYFHYLFSFHVIFNNLGKLCLIYARTYFGNLIKEAEIQC